MSLAFFCHNCGARMASIVNVLSCCAQCAPDGQPLYAAPEAKSKDKDPKPKSPKGDT